jgi:hypothetical protein
MAMDPVLDRLLTPDMVWVLIPLLAIAVWGLKSVIRAIRGTPADFAEWQAEVVQLRARLEALERAQQRHYTGDDAPATATRRP